jgi:hypothetical protein
VGFIAGPQGSKVKRPSMDMFLHQENLAIFKKRLEQPHTAKQHEILLRLQAEEQARELRPHSRE